MNTYFYKAIRKYGIEDIQSVVIAEDLSFEDAKKLEIECIKKYNTFVPKGYNLTKGGDGGSICPHLPKHRYEKYIQKKKDLTSGEKNPNFSGVSNQEILEEAVLFFIKNECLYSRPWALYCKSIGLPMTYTKYRFGGGFQNFVIYLKEELLKRNIQFKDDSFKCSFQGKNWYNDGNQNYILPPESRLIKEKQLEKGPLYVKNKRNQRVDGSV
jgi:hypothetical protein